MNNQLKYVRNDKGEFVKASVGVARTVVSAAHNVVLTYAGLLRGALDLAIRIGLFCYLWPFIRKFVELFVDAASSIGGPL